MQAGERAYGCNLNFPSTTLIELAGRAGFDFVIFFAAECALDEAAHRV